MSKINSFDRSTVRQVNAEIAKALEKVSAKYGVEINLKSTRFSDSNYSTKIEVATIGTGGLTMTKEANDFNRYKAIKGMQFDLGFEFTHQGDSFTVIGFKPRSTKFPVLCKSSNGKTYKFPISIINRNA